MFDISRKRVNVIFILSYFMSSIKIYSWNNLGVVFNLKKLRYDKNNFKNFQKYYITIFDCILVQ